MSYAQPVSALYLGKGARKTRGYFGAGWQKVELVGDHKNGQVVLRETGRFWPGVFLADRDLVRISGPEFEVPK